MKSVQKIDLGLTGYDELFMNDAERKENKLPRIYDIPLSEIDDFPDHPFKVKLDEDMDQLVQSIKERGIITPVTLRPKEDGRYEIVSGHRRKKACELAGFDTVKAEVREMTRDEAIILMVESNLQRSVILPSEKAFSYKMRLEAMKRQAGRPAQDNYSPLGNNSFGTKSSDEMAAEVGESKNTIFRYIRLTELIPELLDLVDEGRIAFRPAVELSYLQKEEQSALLEQIAYADATPSLAQAIKLKRFSQEGKLNNEVIESIISEEKPNQREKINIKYAEARRFIPASVPYEKTGEYIGHKDIALGENPNADKDERYMCCFVETNAIFERYSGVLVSDDFAEIAKVFGQRVADAAEEIIQENERACQEVGMNEELTTNSCKPISYEDSIENKVVVVKGSILRPEFRHANHQLMLCTGGFGAQANARGRTCCCISLYDGRKTSFYRTDFLGVMDEKKLPEWAQKGLEKAKEMHAQEKKPAKERGDAR